MDSVKSALLMDICYSLMANHTDEKILDFADVASGWHFGEGVPISPAAIRDAAKLHDSLLLSGFYETDAFPGLAGEVRVTAYHGNKYFEFTRETNGEWSYIYELDGITESEIDKLTMEQAQEIVKIASNNIWNTSDIFQEGTGISVVEGFKASLSARQPKVEFRLWKSLVPPLSNPCAITSENFILTPGTPLSSGFSRTRSYQTPLPSSNRLATQMTGVIETSPELAARSQRIFSRRFATSTTT